MELGINSYGWVKHRELGVLNGNAYQHRWHTTRALGLGLETEVEIWSMEKQSFLCIDMDSSENRYLLVGGHLGYIAVYDMEEYDMVLNAAREEKTRLAKTRGSIPRVRNKRKRYKLSDTRPPLSEGVLFPVMSLPPKTKNMHNATVSSCQWYPVDTGSYFTGSLDGTSKMWDTETMSVVTTFSISKKVFSIALAPLSTTHSLLAVGSSDPHLRLCDPRSGGNTHSLAGHGDAILSVKWSPANEHIIASGSADEKIKLWDVRKARGCLMTLDQFNTTFGSKSQEKREDDTQSENDGSYNTDDDLPFSHGVRLLMENRKMMAASKKTDRPTFRALYSDDPVSSVSTSSAPRKRQKVDLKNISSHYGGVNSLCFTPDGQFLLSNGADRKMRTWKSSTGENTLINYPLITQSQTQLQRMPQMATDGKIIYQPLGMKIFMFDLHTGVPLATLSDKSRGSGRKAFESCCFLSTRDELFTISNEIKAWTYSSKRLNAPATSLAELKTEEEEELENYRGSDREDDEDDSEDDLDF